MSSANKYIQMQLAPNGQAIAAINAVAVIEDFAILLDKVSRMEAILGHAFPLPVDPALAEAPTSEPVAPTPPSLIVAP